jgi:FkbH-like protein
VFELTQYEKYRHSESPAVAKTPYPPLPVISHNSLLVWGEHCIECAAPACYSSCDLYDARPDGRCRRLQFGAFANPSFPTQRGYGVEVVFRKWAKLEARGNARMWPARKTFRVERWIGAASRLGDAIGRFAAKLTGNPRYAYLSEVLLERLGRKLHAAGNPLTPEAFLLELYNPEPEPVALQVSFGMALEWRRAHVDVRVPPSFNTTLRVPSGYSRHEFEYPMIRRVVEAGPFDISLTPESDTHAHLVVMTADFVRFAIRKDAGHPRSTDIKCIVWDLDNTLWDGVLLEGTVKPKPDLVQLLRSLDQRGILLSIASKNDHESTWPKLVELGIADLFLYPQINWSPKSENIKRIAQLLSLGLDTFAFADDNPFELAEVAAAIPEITCIQASEIAAISGNPRFQGSTSGEAAMRRKLYQGAILREEDEKRFGSDYIGFLKTCGIRLAIDPYAPADFDRCAELVQRTNQLNFSGRKYSRQDLLDIIDDPNKRKYVLRCSDNYGTYGAVGFSIVLFDGDTMRVEDFVLSCRVQGKFIEQAFFAHLAAGNHATRLWVNYTETTKNKPARNVLDTIGFFAAAGGKGVELRDTASLHCDFITITGEGHDWQERNAASSSDVQRHQSVDAV